MTPEADSQRNGTLGEEQEMKKKKNGRENQHADHSTVPYGTFGTAVVLIPSLIACQDCKPLSRAFELRRFLFPINWSLALSGHARWGGRSCLPFDGQQALGTTNELCRLGQENTKVCFRGCYERLRKVAQGPPMWGIEQGQSSI